MSKARDLADSADKDIAGTIVLDDITLSNDMSVATDGKVQFRDSAIYINSSADGQLDIVADTEIQIAATTIDINGAINASGEIIAASLDISGNIDVDGITNLDVVDIDGAVDMATTLAVGGVVTANAGVVVDNITIDGYAVTSTSDILLDSAFDIIFDADANDVLFKDGGTEYFRITNNGTSTVRLDAVGDIILDADGGDIYLDDGGTGFGQISGASSNLTIKSISADKDLIFQGNDGGSTITALTLDMSAAGAATFNSTVETTGLDLTAIAKDISDTAVDVFVYDTRKDSDGGAWRKRTQNTSWYNEALNTSTRGARKEFPSVAVIVAESNQLTIYDGDDPDMPMWMVFDGQSAGGYLGYGIGAGRSLSSVVALNGAIHNGGLVGNWATDINFITERGYFWGEGNSGYTHTAIVNRNTASSINEVSSSIELVHGIIKDIAVTVLPNAPIDADTGLPVPTIAVATNGGVSVIKDDGSVVDLYNSNSAYRECDYVEFTSTDGIVFGQTHSNGAEQFLYKVNSIPNSDTSFTYHDDGVSDLFMMPTKSSSNHVSTGVDFYYLDDVNQSSGHLRKSANKGRALSGKYGLTLLDENLTDAAKGSIAYITTDYNTGWMVGDTKLATLSDTDTTNAVGTELVTNGTFASNITGWTDRSIGTGSVSWNSSGYLNLTSSNSSNSGWITQAFTTVTGKTYVATMTRVANNTIFQIGISSGNNSIYQSGNVATDEAFTFVATASTTYVSVLNYNYNGTSQVDNISVRLAEEDRSVNNNGLQVFGTVTKTAVATGAELVGYSGFSASNYLEQPANSAITSLTSFAFTGWFKTTMTGNGYIFSIGGGNAHARGISIAANSGVLYTWDPTNTQDLFTRVVNDGSWHQVTFITTPTTRVVYIDGVLDSTIAVSAYTTPADSQYRVGVFRESTGTINNIFDGQHALQRFSATIPTAEQIKKMYNDEKFLFQENAKATLYGTSDAVKALAYDDDTELLHVGTSAGRSEFQGLRRVNNTTDAVSAAISASNGFIVEE